MKQSRNRRGQALVMVAFALTLIFGMLSLAVDLGWGYYRREAGQSAADAAAAAAVRAVSGTPSCGTGIVWCGSPAGTITNCPSTAPASATTTYDNACMLAAANGFTTTGSKTVSVQANTTSPPPTVPGVTVTYWVTVRIKETPASFFGVPLGSSGLNPLISNVIATSAIITTGSAETSPCIYVLSPNATDAFDLGNGATVTTSSCGVYVNSTATEAALITGGARLNSPTVQVAGGYAANNGYCLATSSSAACGTLTPATSVAAAADPFVGLPAPTIPSSCSSGNFTSWQARPYTPTAGCYNGFSLGNSMAATMGAGIYVINGGSFSIQGGSTLTATSGVMIYLTNGAYVNIANGVTLNMAPESTGTYQGILFYQDRTMASPTASTFAGGSNSTMTGSLYFPNSLVNINNGSSVNTEALVVGSVNFQGGAAFSQATSQSQTGLAVSSSSFSVLQ